jgi:hypothetical protein
MGGHHRGSHKIITTWFDDLEKQGYSVRQPKSGHHHIRDADGHLLVVVSVSPRDPVMCLRDAKANLKRAELKRVRR